MNEKDPKTKDRRYECSLRIEATPRAVWKALTDARELTRWFASEAEIDPRVGGEVVWRWNDFAWPQVIEVFEEEKRLRTRYDSGVLDEAGRARPLYVEFELEGRSGGTTLRMVHSGFGEEADFDGEYDGISRGWPVELRSLRHYLERHPGVDRHVVSAIVELLDLDPDEAWRELTGPTGFGCADALVGRGEGDSLAFTTASGERFEATLLTNGVREFSACVHSHADSWLRICVEHCGGSWQAWTWLATYGLDGDRRAALQRSFDEIVGHAVGAKP